MCYIIVYPQRETFKGDHYEIYIGAEKNVHSIFCKKHPTTTNSKHQNISCMSTAMDNVTVVEKVQEENVQT